MATSLNLTPELTLRPVTTGNAAELLPLMKACYLPVYEHLWTDGGTWYVRETYNEAAVLKDLSKPQTDYWTVLWRDEPSGIFRLVTGRHCPDIPDPAALKLHRIYLHPAAQGRGIGKQLMGYAEERARAAGCTYLWLEAMDTQTPALKFYERMGLRKTGTFRLTFERMHAHLRGMVRMGKNIRVDATGCFGGKKRSF